VRRLVKGGIVLLLLALWVSPAAASTTSPTNSTSRRNTIRKSLKHATLPVRVAMCDPRRPEPSALTTIISQPTAVGGPVAKRPKRSRIELARIMTVGRRTQTPKNDDVAIPNDTPAAHVDAHPIFTLRPLGIFVDVFEQQPYTVASAPRSQRGPPTTQA